MLLFIIDSVSLKFIATAGSLAFGLFVSLLMLSVYNPAQGNCFNDDPIYIEQLIQIISSIFCSIVGAIILLLNYRRRKTKPLKNNASVSIIWSRFSNEVVIGWLVSVIIGCIVAFSNTDLYSNEKQYALILISICVFAVQSQIYSNLLDNMSSFFGATVLEAIDFQKTSKFRQNCTQALNLALIIVFVGCPQYVKDQSQYQPVVIVILLIRLFLEVLLLRHFIILYKLIHQVCAYFHISFFHFNLWDRSAATMR